MILMWMRLRGGRLEGGRSSGGEKLGRRLRGLGEWTSLLYGECRLSVISKSGTYSIKYHGHGEGLQAVGDNLPR